MTGARVEWLVWGLVVLLLVAVVVVTLVWPTEAAKVAIVATVAIPILTVILRRCSRSPVLDVASRALAAAAATPTVELPLGQAHHRAVSRALRRTVVLHASVSAATIAGLLLLGLVLRPAVSSPANDTFDPVVALGIGGGVVGLAAALGGWHRVDRLRRDGARGSFLRTIGPVGLRSSGTTVIMELADRTFPVSQRVAWKVPTRFVGTVDHSPSAHLVFEIRDAEGAVLFRDGGYHPPPDSVH